MTEDDNLDILLIQTSGSVPVNVSRTAMCHNNSPFYFSFNAEHLQIHQRRMSITDKLRDVKSKQRISCYNNRCRKQPVRAGADRLLSCWRICCGVASSLFSLSPPSIPPQTALTVKTDKGEGLHSSYYIVHKVYHILSPWLYLVFQVCPPPRPHLGPCLHRTQVFV